MDPILTFIVLPLATIIFSIALQRLLKCPILVAVIVFAIFLILTYTVFGTDFLIFAILFAILAFITAFLVCIICKILRRWSDLEDRDSDCNSDCDNNNSCGCSNTRRNSIMRSNRSRNCRCDCDDSNDNDEDNLLTISGRCGNGETAELLTISTSGMCGTTNNNNNNCTCNNANNNNSNQSILVNAEVMPSNNERSGVFRGGFRRRCN